VRVCLYFSFTFFFHFFRGNPFIKLAEVVVSHASIRSMQPAQHRPSKRGQLAEFFRDRLNHLISSADSRFETTVGTHFSAEAGKAEEDLAL
jgi:hypothetical protein